MIKCAFDRTEEECSALKVKTCKGCGFFKSEEKLFAGRENADRRVSTLPEDFRKYIYDKYYARPCPKSEEDETSEEV